MYVQSVTREMPLGKRLFRNRFLPGLLGASCSPSITLSGIPDHHTELREILYEFGIFLWPPPLFTIEKSRKRATRQRMRLESTIQPETACDTAKVHRDAVSSRIDLNFIPTDVNSLTQCLILRQQWISSCFCSQKNPCRKERQLPQQIDFDKIFQG
jgi:hypothetical protein